MEFPSNGGAAAAPCGNCVLKFTVQIELAPETRIVRGRTTLQEQLQNWATSIARWQTQGPEPLVTVIQEEQL